MGIRRQNNRKKGVAFLVCLLTALFFLHLIPQIITFKEIENKTWDWRSRLVVNPLDGDPKIRIIEISQDDLDNRAKDGIVWPWPRSMYVPVIKYLEHAGAKGVAFDLLFTEASIFGAEEDLQLGSALKSVVPIISAVALSDSNRAIDPVKFDLFRNRQISEQKRSPFAYLYNLENNNNFLSLTLPIPELLINSAGFGNVTSIPDSDGVFRHYSPVANIANLQVLGLPFALYSAVYNEPHAIPKLTDYIDQSGRLIIRFRDARSSYKPIRIDQIIDSYLSLEAGQPPNIPLESFKDSWVFIGTSAPGLLDLRPTPLSERGNGVEINAVVLDNLLHGDFVRKVVPHIANSLSILFIMATITLVFFIPLGGLQGVIITLLILLPTIASVILAFLGFWLPLVAPTISVVIALLLALAFQFQLEGKQHRFIKNAFRYYVSPSLIDEIVSDPSSLALGGERRELTIFFSDVKGFTSIAEGLEATKLVALINRFLTVMTDTIQSHSGTVDKYVGDAVVAFWNAPLPVTNHAIKGVMAALECQKRVSELSKHFHDEFGVKIELRIGIHTGIATVGNFGSQERFSYTMIGDSVNLASRLEGANKFFGTSILLSSATQELVNELIPNRKVADIRVVGRSEPVTVYEPLFHDKGLTAEEAKIFSNSLKLYESGEREKALQHFKTIPNDIVARNYVERLEREIGKGQNMEWTPIWNLVEK